MEKQSVGRELEQWTIRAAQSYQELARVFSAYVADRKKEEQEQWLPEQECVGQCGSCHQLARTKRAAYNQMLEGQEALVYQLEETAQYFRQMECSIKREQYMSEEQQRELLFFLRRYHIKAREPETARRAGKGRELTLTLRCDGIKRTMSTRLVERLLSEKLGYPVKADNRSRGYISEEEQRICFCEVPGYYCLTGVARMMKEEQKVSGDAFSFFYEEDGELAMILSDGMGSGEAAAKESESVLGLLEKLLSAGFKEETAIRLINSVLALRAEQNMFATLDISRVNLYSGTCEFIKIGGAATYLRCGKWLECVEARTLPIGMVQQVDYDCLVKKLYDGDYIIMMSDGVLDVIPPGERANFLQQIIGEEPGESPQVIAGRILNASLLVQNFEPKDDMTVLVCGVFQRKGAF